MSLQEEYREIISRVMSRMPIGKSGFGIARELLTIQINQSQPQGMTREEAEMWAQEKQRGLDDWDRELETDGSVTCAGGSLIQTPISEAIPESLPTETYTQLPLI
jgi:hypothetical protein